MAPPLGPLHEWLAHADPKLRADAAWEVGRQRLRVAAPKLRKLLRDRDVGVRKNAAWALGELGQPENAFPLHDRLLREPDPGVQAELAIALGKVRYRTVRPLLLGLTWKSDPVLKAAGITAVGYLGDPTAMKYLLHFQGSPDPMLRKTLAEALGRTGGRAARAALLKLLGDPASTVRVAALEAVSRLGVSEAAPFAERLLGAGQAELRRQAAAALGRLGDRRHVGALAALLEDDHPEVAAEAALSLAHLGGILPSPRLRTLLASKHNAALRAATQAAGLAGNREVIPTLEALLDHPSSPLREVAAVALGRLAAGQSLPKLISRLTGAPPRELQALLGAIGALRDASALGAVVHMVSHPDADVRAAAVGALAQMATLDPRPFTFLSRRLLPLLGARQPPALLRAAADAFTRLHPPLPRNGFIAPMRLTLHADPGVRRVATRSLGRYGDRLARPALERLRRDPDPSVRLETSLALLRLDAPHRRGLKPGTVLPDCDLQPPKLRIRCLVLRAAWLPRERDAALQAFRRAGKISPSTPEATLLVDFVAELDASFSIPLLQEARRSPCYLLRAAARRALSVWPPPVPQQPREAIPTPVSKISSRETSSVRRDAETLLFDGGTPMEGCSCAASEAGPGDWIPWLLVFTWLLLRRRTRDRLASHVRAGKLRGRPHQILSRFCAYGTSRTSQQP